MTLSRGQFKQLAAQANDGGFSVKEGEGGRAVGVTDSYMVGGVTPGVSHDAPVSGRQVVSFVRSNKGLMSRSDMALGAWHDTDRTPTSQVDLDVSQAYPRTPEGRSEVGHATVTRNEMAFGELGPKGEYTQHDNPFSTRRNAPDYRKTLRANPHAYEAVVSGNVLGGMFSWAKG